MKFQSVLLALGLFVLSCGSMSASAVIHSSVFNLQDCTTSGTTASAVAADDCIGALDSAQGTVNPSAGDINSPLSLPVGASGGVSSVALSQVNSAPWNPGAFGYNDWREVGRFNDGDSGANSSLGLTVVSGSGGSRDWSVNTPLNGMWMLVVKQSGRAALYLFDELAGVSGGTIDLSRFGQNSNGYSHVSLLTRDSGDGEVPVPATFALIALGMVTLVARRRKTRLSTKG